MDKTNPSGHTPGLVDAATFLCERLRDVDGASSDPVEFVREFYGHVQPALARMEAALAKATGQ